MPFIYINVFCGAIYIYKRLLRCYLYIETIFLPRQARDKHRESIQNEGVFSFLGEDRAPEDSGALGGAEAAHPHVGKEVS